MHVINWLALQPLLADVDTLNMRLQESLSIRDAGRSLVEIILGGYPWPGRSDLIPWYQPSRTYQSGQWIALPVPDPQNPRPTAWRVAQVTSAEITGNSIQGRFQALVLDVGGKEVQQTAGLAGAAVPEPELSGYTPKELGWLADWVADTYAGPLLGTLRKLIQKGRIHGQIVGTTFLPEQMFALSLERIEPFFARLSPALRWVSLEEILQGLPDLASLHRETALALVRSTLKASPYRSLGGDRWTTPALFDQLDRVLPCGLPAAHIRSKSQLWTRQDKKDLAIYLRKPIPAEAACALEELGIHEARSEPSPSPWAPPQEHLRLPALNTFHIMQACLPVGHALHAFPPDVRMVFLQWIEGKYQPFLLDRELGLLKAANPEALQARILEEGLPAGTFLWLEYQGGEKYRISPQPLATMRQVPCIRASLQNGTLQLEHSQTQLKVESEASVFQVDLNLEDLQLLYTEARCRDHSIRDALASAIQELCAVDPHGAARRTDIFNLVFLKKFCSPQAAAVLLNSLPCFVQLNGGYFRFMNHTTTINIWKQTNRVSQLWEDLAANCVAPDPRSRAGFSPGVDREPNPLVTLVAAPGAGRFSPLETDLSPFPGRSEEHETGEKPLMERVGRESIHLIKHALEALTAPAEEAPVADPELEKDLDGLQATSEEVEKTRVEALPTQASPYQYPVFIKVPFEPDPQPTSAIETRRIVYGLKIPAKPLHKRPIYQRVIYCLRIWIHKASGRSLFPGNQGDSPLTKHSLEE